MVIGNFSTTTVTNNSVLGNFIGMDSSGSSGLPNGGGDYAAIATRLNQVVLDATGESPDLTGPVLEDIEGGVTIFGPGNFIGGAIEAQAT